MTVEPSWPPGVPARWSLMLPKEAPAVRTARGAVETWLADAPASLRDDARSVVTELVGNAIQYGEPPIQLRVERTVKGFRIDVADAGAHRPRRGPRAGGSGWGLRIVDAIADSWGVADDASRVWCLLRARTPG